MFHRIGKDGKRYWHKKGAGIFFTDGKSVLMLRRKPPCDHSKTWCLPGGGAKAGENALDNAIRESIEECGKVQGERFSKLEEIDGHHHWTTFFYKVNKQFKVKLSNEHDAWKWIKFADLKNYDLHPALKANIDRHLKIVNPDRTSSFREFCSG